MRTLSLSIIVCGVLTALPAAAQQPAPPPPGTPPPAEAPKADVPVVNMDNGASAGQPAPPPAAPAAPAPVVVSSPASVGGAAAPSSDWKFDFHGYFRAPLRIGLGVRDKPLDGQSKGTIHSPIVPDDQYLAWQYTSVQSKDWSEVFLSYGNSWVKGTVGLQGFNFTDAAWEQGSAQFGIAQGYLTLTPELPWENVRLEAKVGSFWGKYGMAGRYDSGKYDTYLFGRTHTIGEAVRMELDLGKLTLWGEEGFGAKQPDPSVYNNAKFTLLTHFHGGLIWDKSINVNLHLLHSWEHEEDRDGTTLKDLPDGSLTVTGAEFKWTGAPFGDLYFGFSHIGASNATNVADAIEVLHSGGGGEYHLGVTDNYLNGPKAASKGNGAVNSLLAQLDFSLATTLGKNKPAFFEEGRDVNLSLFTMWNAVSSDDKDMDGVKKFKFGADLSFNALKWLGLGARFDRVQPNSKIPEQSFGILSPRLFFRTAWFTHEEIILQYSRYMYNQRTCAAGADPTLCVQPPPSPVLPAGFGATSANQDANTRGAPTTRPDLNVFKIQASMWW